MTGYGTVFEELGDVQNESKAVEPTQSIQTDRPATKGQINGIHGYSRKYGEKKGLSKEDALHKVLITHGLENIEDIKTFDEASKILTSLEKVLGIKKK